MAVGRGSMARASKAAAKDKEVVQNPKGKAAENSETASVETKKIPAKATKTSATRKKSTATKRPAAAKKKEAEKKNTVGIGQEMPIYFY